MTTIYSDWIPRERNAVAFKLKDLPRFYGRVWFPEDPTAPSQPLRDDAPPTQPETKPKEKD